MATDLYVTVTGPALSFLMYENVKGLSDQRGFLLGEVINHVTQSISDSDFLNEKSETFICVNSSLPIPDDISFDDEEGRLDENVIMDFLQDKKKEVIGWYSFRPNHNLAPMLGDKLFHKRLISMMKHAKMELFSMCLLSTYISTNGSTHSFNHRFMRFNMQFEAIPVQIPNLGDTTSTDYRINPCKTTLPKVFQDVMSMYAGESKEPDSLVHSMQNQLQEHLRTLIDEIAISESHIAELEQEVITLRQTNVSNEILLPKLLQVEIPSVVNGSPEPESKYMKDEVSVSNDSKQSTEFSDQRKSLGHELNSINKTPKTSQESVQFVDGETNKTLASKSKIKGRITGPDYPSLQSPRSTAAAGGTIVPGVSPPGGGYANAVKAGNVSEGSPARRATRSQKPQSNGSAEN